MRDMHYYCTVKGGFKGNTVEYYYNINNKSCEGTEPRWVLVSVHGGLLPDIILSTRCSYIGEPF